MIEKGEVFAWKGQFEAFFSCTPPFDAAQHKEVNG